MPELSLNGLPLCFDEQRQAADFLDKYQPLDDLLVQIDHAIQTQNGSVGPSLIGLPKPNYPDPPPPRINQLYWPTGAARWARGYFLAPKTTADQLASSCGTAVDLVATVNTITLTIPVFPLTPHPVSCSDDTSANTLFIIPVVDERYWWQFKHFGNMGKPQITDWDALFTHVAGQLGVSITVDDISGDYLNPDPEEFTRRYDNAATILDAMAHSIGQRIVRQFDGTVRSISWDLSGRELFLNLDSRTPWWQVAGDSAEHKPIPGFVQVAFPRTDCSLPTCERKFYTIRKSSTDFNSKCRVDSTFKTIHSTAWANFAPSAQLPTNDTELQTLATKIARDYYLSLDKYYDYTFAGLKDWYFTGYDDAMLISFGTEYNEPSMEASTDVYRIKEQDYEASTELKTLYSKGYFSRVHSMPLNFGVDTMLQQGTVEASLPLGVVPVAIKDGEFLLPGSFAQGWLLKWNGQDWAPDTTCEHTIYDPFYRNFLIGGERVWARRSCENGRLEIVGENGLRRQGLAQQAIAPGQSGAVEIVTGIIGVFGVGSCLRANSGIIVTACLLPSAPPVSEGQLFYLHYHPDHFRWHIISAIGAGTLIRFEMQSALPLGGKGTAIEVGTGPAFTPIGSSFPIKDPWTNPGMWRYDPKQGAPNANDRGYMGWCVLPPDAEIEQGEPVREIVWMEQISRSINFKLTEDIFSGQFGLEAKATVSDFTTSEAWYLQGKDPDTSDLIAGSPPQITVYDPCLNYPRALKDANGKARYNDKMHRYEIVECNQMAIALTGFLGADMCSEDSAGLMAALQALTFPPYGQLPDPLPTVGTNRYGCSGTSQRALLTLWNESSDEWDIAQVRHVPRTFIYSAILSQQGCGLRLEKEGETIAVMTCGQTASATSIIQFTTMNMVTGVGFTDSTTQGSDTGVCALQVQKFEVCVLATGNSQLDIIPLQAVQVMQTIRQKQGANCLEARIITIFVPCSEDAQWTTVLCGDDCSSGSGAQQ